MHILLTLQYTLVLDEYTMLLTLQYLIGTNSLFFELFSSNWYSIPHRYLQVCPLPSNANQADNAINSLFLATLIKVHEIWLLHNARLHSTDSLQKHSYVHLHLLAKIQELYNCTPLVLAEDWENFSYPFKQQQDQLTAALLAYYY